MKNWYESRTLLWNLITLVVLVAGVLLDNAGVLALPSQYAVYLGVIVAVGNAVLRLDTSTAIVGTPAAAALAPVRPGPPTG